MTITKESPRTSIQPIPMRLVEFIQYRFTLEILNILATRKFFSYYYLSSNRVHGKFPQWSSLISKSANGSAEARTKRVLKQPVSTLIARRHSRQQLSPQKFGSHLKKLEHVEGVCEIVGCCQAAFMWYII